VNCTDIAELERACEEAMHAGVSQGVIEAARRRVRQLIEEQMLAAAIMDARARHIRDTAFLVAAVQTLDAASEERRQGPALDEQTTERLIADAQERMRHSLETNILEACTICLEQLHRVENHQPDHAQPLPSGKPSDQQRDNSGFCMLPCGHAFHASCVRSWISSHGTCPNCRLRAEVESNHPPQQKH